MLPSMIIINGKQITKNEFIEMCERDRRNKIAHIIESHNGMEWVTDGELYFEDCDIAYEYYETFHNGYIDELTPINPDEIVKCVYSDTQIITQEILDKMIEEQEENYNNKPTQYDLDNEIYYKIVREGLGL